ncbi:hypothetical protein N657DRAFT_330091 [Parathielavia appendiculata]|uniref:Glycine zipper 2TM domain-containing protein n=1 Tax=Parathielavia appendiculata TaxID=2587402 RepID=A0AAN6TQB0_9PEZI|nr:hypothetical protein N657DRAFT_330091 [Parathielavia appendiculata]
MPHFRSDSDSSDYSPRRHRSPRRRSPTPGSRRIRDLSPVNNDHHYHPRLQFESHTPFYPVASGANGPGPRTRRPHSTGTPSTDTFATTTTSTLSPEEATTMSPARKRTRSRSRYTPSTSSISSSDDDDDEHRDTEGRYLHPGEHGEKNPHPRSKSRSPLDKARSLLSSNLTTSTSGLGVGVLGAIVGGLAASEAAHHHSHAHDHKRRGGYGDDYERAKHLHLISTVVGAAVGGLGANAIEKKIEARGRDKSSLGREGGVGGDDRERERERQREKEAVRYRDDVGGGGGGGRRRSGEWKRY